MFAPSAIIICGCMHVAALSCFLDDGSREEIGADVTPVDRLKFRDSKKYKDRLSAAQKETGEKDALIAMRGTLEGLPVVAVAFEFSFMGGSMGAVVGERFVRCCQCCAGRGYPADLFLGFRWRAHAGGSDLPDADGQDKRCA